MHLNRTHVMQFPTGKYGYVGSIPRSICSEVPASQAAVMGGRAYRNSEDRIVESKSPVFDTLDEAVAHAKGLGVQVYVDNVPV